MARMAASLMYEGAAPGRSWRLYSPGAARVSNPTGPPGASAAAAAQVAPGAAVGERRGVQRARARVLGLVELQHHPLRIRNAGIGDLVERPKVFGRELQVARGQVVLQVLGGAGRDEHRADGGA